MGPSMEGAGGSAGERHRPWWWASRNPGAGVGILGKGCEPMVGRWVVGAGGRLGPESSGLGLCCHATVLVFLSSWQQWLRR